ncbi:creatininase family protein [Rariglobus hedericola]|uniref:Creatininase n=1 Tax=Rariglobus hedericola TaxID=2597822 RepID=A0A556QMD4_9BACT|nr:creatininase family protein [Rariglobus hedericola]TSJ77811.1 creatininase [Rariglobus hedericola]
MSSLWLANAEPTTAWAHQTWSDLSARPNKARTLVVLPIHGFADHGFGLPLNTEETVGSALLRAAIVAGGLQPHVLVLPPLRFGAAPYAHTHFGVDTETALETLNEILASVKASGFTRVLLFNTSPWNGELAATAALDSRVSLNLRTYVIGAASLGLGFHPTDANRPHTQAVAAHLLGGTPATFPLSADVRDTDFRPGYFGQPAPLTPDATLNGERLFIEATTRLVDLLGEVVVHDTDLVLPVPKPVAPAAALASPQSRELASLTAFELAAIPDKAHALVIIPTGAIEQHGHHLPLGTDALLGRVWLQHALPKLAADAPVFVAPSLTYGKSNEHTGFAGTITLTARTLRRQLLSLATHLKAQGFRQIAVLNTHGGNSAVIVPVLRELQSILGLRAGMLSGYYRPSQSPQEASFGFHAGEWETSLLLATAPELVHMDRAVCEYPARTDAPGTLRPEGAAAVFAWKTSDLSQSGVMGDATLATAEKGTRWLEEASTALARKIESLISSS